MTEQEKLKTIERVQAHLLEIRLMIDDIHDEFNPDEFEELAKLITNLDFANEDATYYCLRFK